MAGGLGQRIAYRCGSEAWKGLDAPPERATTPAWSPYFGPEGATQVNVRLGELIDHAEPEHLDFLAHEWRRLGGHGMSIGDARRAVEAINPQMVIESILSASGRTRAKRPAGARGGRPSTAGGAPAWRASPATIAGTRSWSSSSTKWSCSRPSASTSPSPSTSRRRSAGSWCSPGPARGWRPRPPASPTTARGSRRSATRSRSPRGAGRTRSTTAPAPPRSPTRPLERSDEARDETLKKKLWALRVLDDCLHYDKDLIDAFWKKADKDPLLLEISELFRQAYRRQRRSVLDRMSKAAQKPGFCVPRSAAGSKKDRLLPKEYSWKGWYVGPNAPRPRKDP